jgi:hypothetical protein
MILRRAVDGNISSAVAIELQPQINRLQMEEDTKLERSYRKDIQKGKLTTTFQEIVVGRRSKRSLFVLLSSLAPLVN